MLRCPLAATPGLFSYVRVERDGAGPPFDRKVVGVAVLAVFLLRQARSN